LTLMMLGWLRNNLGIFSDLILKKVNNVRKMIFKLCLP
jgi:hypothetical protein